MQTVPKPFDPFVPDLLKQSLLRSGASSDEPFAETVPAALLFGDLSGFTEFAERLANDHAHGIEETQRVLNEHFCRVLAVIERWGGTVLKFAGDGTIALWTADGDGLAAATRYAVCCGLEIQALIHAASVDGGPVLRQRLVIGAGDLWLAHFGGTAGKWEFTAAGAPWDQVRAAEEVARPGAVMVSPEAWALLEAVAEGHAVGPGCRQITRCRAEQPRVSSIESLYPAHDERPARYVSRTTKAQIEAGHHYWIAERRHVSVLFLKIIGIEIGAPDALARLHEAAQAVHRVIGEQDGNILQFLMEDKGLVVLTAWGLALTSHEDDAERAVMAALRLREELCLLGLSSQIGIHSGRVFAGLLGNERHLEYAIIGDPVNTAARLMALSDGEPLCDRRTKDAAQRRFALELVSCARLKGKSEPIEVYRIVAKREIRQRRSHAMVGRAEERHFAEQILDATSLGTGLVIHVVGEPGIGKSSLSELLLERARARGITCAVGAADGLRGKEQYFAWTAVLPVLLGVDDIGNADELRAALATLPPSSALPAGEDLVPLLNPLLPSALPESPFTLGLDTGGRADLTRELLAELAATATRRAPLLILLDDVHWLDSASWQLVATLQRRVPELTLVLLSRPLQRAHLPIEARRVLESPAIRTLELRPLSFDECRELIAAHLRVESISDQLARRIYERAEGNPLFTEELLLSLEQQGAINRVEQGATLVRESGRPTRIAFSEGIEGVVASRIDGLDAAQQLSIKVASILGRSFALKTLCALRPIALLEDELAAQLEAMCRTRLLEPDQEAGERAYRFRHAVIQDVVHDLLTTEQQQQLHRAAAVLLENDASLGHAGRSALLAHHWGIAQDDRQAIKYLEQAARQAHENHAKVEVMKLLLEALERADRCAGIVSAERRASWDLLLGEAELDLGLFTRAKYRLGRAIGQLHQPLPRGRAELGIRLAREVALHGRLRLGAPSPQVLQHDRALAAARCYAALGFIHYNDHELGEMLHATMAGANLAIGVGSDSAIHARMLAYLSIIAAGVPGIDPAYYTSSALRMAERLGDVSALQEVLLTIATYETGAAKYRDAIEHFERSIQLARSIGEVRAWEVTLGSLANVHRLRGELRLADAADSQVLRSGFDRNIAQTQVWGFFGRVCTLTLQNRFDELAEQSAALGRLLDDEEVLGQVSASNLVAHLLTKALLELHRGDDSAAFQALERSVALLDSLGHLQVYMTCTISYLQDALMACWRRRSKDRRVLDWLAKADRFVDRCGRMFPSAVPRALLGRGNLALRNDRPGRARSLFEAALREARKNDNPYDEACAHESLSMCRAVPHAARAQHAGACARVLGQLELERPFTWAV